MLTHFLITISTIIMLIAITIVFNSVVNIFKDTKIYQVIVFTNKFNVTIMLLMLIVCFCVLLNQFVYDRNWIKYLADNNLGQVGDFFNGLTTPIVSIVSIYILYKAFEQQYKANELLGSFEERRGLKEEIEWLRTYSDTFKNDINLLKRIATDEDLIENIETNSFVTKKLIYILLVFEDLDNKTNNERNKLADINNDVMQLFLSFYLEDLKYVFRRFDNLSNNIDTWDSILPLVEFQSKFKSCYRKLAFSKDHDPGFKNTLRLALINTYGNNTNR